MVQSEPLLIEGCTAFCQSGKRESVFREDIPEGAIQQSQRRMPGRDVLEKEGEIPRPRKKGEVRILPCCSMKAFAVGS